MAEYIDKNDLDIAFKDECTGDCSCCSYWEMESYGHDCNLIHNFPSIDVVEREKIDKAIAEIKDGYYGNEEKSETDSERAEAFNNGLSYALEILKRNIGEVVESK